MNGIKSELDTTLHEPLLGVLPVHIHVDEENGYQGDDDDDGYVSFEDDVDVDDVGNQEGTTVDARGGDRVVVWCILPALVELQFALAFWYDPESVATLQWTTVNYCIALFVLTSWLYRQACYDAALTASVVVLVPEMVMDVVIAAVLLGHAAWAFTIMLCAMLVLALFVAGSSLRILYVYSSNRALRSSSSSLAGKPFEDYEDER